MKFIIAHYHYRPGGVRRIIELALPYLAASIHPPITEVLLLGGELPDSAWLTQLQNRLGKIPVKCCANSALGYFSEQSAPAKNISLRIRRHLSKVLSQATASGAIVWAHNLGLARNLLLSRELVHLCKRHSIPLVSHHHDWWFENRWSRWPEMQRCGYDSLQAVAETIFADGMQVCHAAINQTDAELLNLCSSSSNHWLPNLAQQGEKPSDDAVKAAKRWLIEHLGSAAPIWLLPCRLLRRKNVAEALLLTRWLHPDAQLATTAGVSSADEKEYACKLAAEARRNKWPLKLGILKGPESSKPSVAEVLAATQVVLLTSIQEGFGLPYIEAAAAQRPLIARRLPNIAPDLDRFGFTFPQSYEEVLVPPILFDIHKERRRQERLFAQWRNRLPEEARKRLSAPFLLENRDSVSSVPFSRLTLTAQIEVLSAPVDASWAACLPFNPFLHPWRERAASGRLLPSPWPRQAARWLGGKTYARKFTQLLASAQPAKSHTADAWNCQLAFLDAKLKSQYLYPLLWNSKT